MDTGPNLPGLGDVLTLTDFDGTELPAMVKMLGEVRRFRMDDIDDTLGIADLLVGQWVTAVMLKNSLAASAAVLPKRIYVLKTDGTVYQMLQNIGTIGTTPYTTRLAVFADPFLPAAGCANAKGCWGIVAGPTIAMTAAAHANAEDLAVGDRVTVANEATGRISGFAAPGSFQNAMDYANSVLGYAMEAAPCTAVGHQDLDKWVLANVPWWNF